MDIKAFLKQNALECENEKYVASDRFIDDNKKPIEWEIKPISTDEDAQLRDEHMKMQEVASGKKRIKVPQLNQSAYLCALAVRCPVSPNLNSAELQDSYGVKGAERLLKRMLTPGEYYAYLEEIQRVNGFDIGLVDKVEDAKN